jgi:hypothetical protein
VGFLASVEGVTDSNHPALHFTGKSNPAINAGLQVTEIV